MRTPRHIFASALLAGLLATPAVCPAQVTDEQVERTMEAMKAYLYSQQKEDGSWGEGAASSRDHGGVTALVALSLLLAGDSPQTANLSRAIGWLERADLNEAGTYAVSLRTHVWAQLSRNYQSRLQSDAGTLLDLAASHPDKLFRYTRASGQPDMSVGQYGLLGVWEAAKRQVAIPRGFWKHHLQDIIARQNDDGGWSYIPGRSSGSSGSMTSAGLTVLYIVQQQHLRHLRTPDPDVAVAIERGLKWMDKNFAPDRNPGASLGDWVYYYYLYSVERVALAGGIRTFRDIDWYHAGAQLIVNQAMQTGKVEGSGLSPEVHTAFALMFLARGRYPVMVLKLRVPDMRWNDRPMDLFHFAQFLSDDREAEMNWQVVDVDSDSDGWINSPILFFSSADAIKLTDQQKTNIKRYVDLGGTLICSPDNGSSHFQESARALATELYPDHPVRPLSSDDPIFEAYDPNRREAIPEVNVVSNGARNLVYIATSDWSYEFQAGKNVGVSPPWQIMTNIWASATNRGKMTGRLAQHHGPRVHRDTAGVVTVGRVRHGGNWDPEPLAWEMASNHIWNRGGVDVRAEPVDLAALAESKAPLAHLAGIEGVRFTDKELEALEAYIRGGGRVLVENIGGNGTFSQELSRQLAKRLLVRERPLPPSHPVLTGEGLPGGYDNGKTFYRPFATLKLGLTQPFLAAMEVDGRVAVIIAHQDLSLGALGLRHWHVLGYEQESARRLLTNIVLWAAGAG